LKSLASLEAHGLGRAAVDDDDAGLVGVAVAVAGAAEAEAAGFAAAAVDDELLLPLLLPAPNAAFAR